MRPVLCDVCGRMERTSYAGSTISYSYPRINGLFYPEDLCDACTVILIDTLTQARREEIEKQQKAQQQAQQPKDDNKEEQWAEDNKGRMGKIPDLDDNNPATQ